jgi:hypothetical protein
MDTDETNNNTKQKSSTRRRSRLCRTHSASIINHENDDKIHSSRRRKSYSTTGLANELKTIPNNEQPTNIDKVLFVIF